MDIAIGILAALVQLALVVLGIHVSLKPPSKERHRRWIAAFIIIGVIGVAFSGVLAWRTSQSQDKIENVLGIVSKDVKGIKESERVINVGPINVQPLIEPPKGQSARAEITPPLRLLGPELLPFAAGKPVGLNVHFQNIGNVKEHVENYHGWAVILFTSDESSRLEFEKALSNAIANKIKQGGAIPFEVPPHSSPVWFTIESVRNASEGLIKEIQDGKYISYYFGTIRYKDINGFGEIQFCYFNVGNPLVGRTCYKHNDSWYKLNK